MNIVLSVFTAKAFKDFILPNVNNTNYSVLLEREVYGISTDTVLQFDVIENEWRLLAGAGCGYSIRTKEGKPEQLSIKSGIKFEIVCADGTVVRVRVAESNANFLQTAKYFVKGKSITIGSAADNDIICKASFISHSHAKISYVKDGWHIEDLSQNGVFVNSVRVKVNTVLRYGDFINIVGLKLVFLDNIIAICDDDQAQVYVNPRTLVKANLEPAAETGNEEAEEPAEKEYFNRAPRILRELYTDDIEIEAPPGPKNEEERSFLMTIGPSFTMAIPMFLGCMMMILSSRSNGGTANPFMFTGLITAVSSAIVGSFWGILNYRNARKKRGEDEQHRFEAYSNYIMRFSEECKDKSRHNAEVMNEIYPSAEECTAMSAKNSSLWNRNISHEDFLVHRVGIGDVPFQAQISIPKEKFTLIDDSLADKPKLIKETYSILRNVPICLDLQNNKLIGIVGGKDKAGAYEVMKNLSAQIAASNCYTDVKMGYIFKDSGRRSSVAFAKWLPHCWSEDKKTRFCAFDEEEASDLCYEMTKIFRHRDENAKESYSKTFIPKPHYVLFVEDISVLEGEPLAKYVFDSKDEYGLTTILFAENYEDLPNSCECIVYNDGAYTGIYTPNTLSSLGNHLHFDSVSDADIDAFARTLSKIEVAEVETGGEIPNSLTFLDMYKVDRVEKLNVIERWKKNRTYENMRSLIGQKAGGVDCYLDIHEKYHGPHGLVAGTTGSGKSETLQTYILSLALNYSPDDVGFLLVDFKGGGMANLFTDLPHTLGQISNLSGAQVRRAMISIKSENLRRQRVLSEHGVNNINAYTRLLKNNEATVPMPHLFIIIDEFAELKREEPEFMAELISVAQVGRSLGVHLILATQKPGGVVDDNIRSNSKFKLCLRVQDKQDSSEMLGKPDAAYLSQAGRCYLQVGNDEIFELFQSGWSGATYDDAGGTGKNNLVKLISSTGKTSLLGNKTALKFKESVKLRWLESLASCIIASSQECGVPLSETGRDFEGTGRILDMVFELLEQMEMDFPKTRFNEKTTRAFVNLLGVYGENNIPRIVEEAHKRSIVLPEPKEKSQLDAVIAHIDDVAHQYGYHRGMPLWMPMLPEYLYLDTVGDYSKIKFDGKTWSQKPTWSLAAPIGMCDDPENQAQVPLIVNFAESGHLAVCGNVTSGKSTFLQTLIYSLINIYSPEQLNVYAIDFSNHMLQSFEKAPHVGNVMYENDNEKIDKFFYMLSKMLEARKKAIGGGNYGQYVNANGYVFPSVLVAIDNYSNFREKTDDKYERIIWELSRDGASFGIFLAISAGGFGSIEIQNKIGENIRNVIALDLGEKMKFSEILRINHLDIMPSGNKGRGLTPYADTVLEFQTALSLEAEDDYSRAEAIREQCEHMSAVYKGTRAMPVPEIPEKPTWTEISANPQFIECIGDASRLPFAYVKETAAIYSADLKETFCYLLQGKTRTGRTDLLRLLAASAKAKGADVCIFDPDDVQLKRFSEKLGVKYASTAKEIYDYSTSLLKIFKGRNAIKREMLENGAEDDEIFARMSKEQPIFIFVSNFAAFLKMVYTAHDSSGLMNGFFENILEKGRLHNIYFVFDSNMEDIPSMLGRKIYSIVTGYKSGVQLGGLAGQKVFDVSGISFVEQGKSYRPGTGMAFGLNGGEKIVIPSSKGV